MHLPEGSSSRTLFTLAFIFSTFFCCLQEREGGKETNCNVAESGFPVPLPGDVSLKSLKHRAMLTCFPIFPQWSLSHRIAHKSGAEEAGPAQELKKQSPSGWEKRTGWGPCTHLYCLVLHLDCKTKTVQEHSQWAPREKGSTVCGLPKFMVITEYF